MTRDEVIEKLRRHGQEVQEQFAVDSLAVFGAASRDELSEDSDVDVLASFAGGATFDSYFGLKEYLETLLGARVDLATPNMIKSQLRREIEKDLIHVT